MALGDVAGLLSPMIDAAANMADAFVPIGRILLAVAFTLTMLTAVYAWWLGEASGAIARAVRGSFVFAVPFFLLWGNNWTDTMSAFTQGFAVELAAPVLQSSGHGGAGGSAPELVKTIVERVANGIWPDAQEATDTSKGTFATAWSFITNPDQSFGRAIFSAWTEFFFKLILTILGAWLIIAILFAMYTPIMIMQVGVIFGPLLVVWLAWEPLAHHARTWFSFMLIAGFSLLVGLVLSLIAVGSIEAFVGLMQAMGQDPELPWFMEAGAKIGGFIASGAVMAYLGFMLFKSDDIAAAMIGGNAGGGSMIGAAIMSKMTPRGAAPKAPAAGKTTTGGGPPPPPPPGGGGGSSGGSSIANAGARK